MDATFNPATKSFLEASDSWRLIIFVIQVFKRTKSFQIFERVVPFLIGRAMISFTITISHCYSQITPELSDFSSRRAEFGRLAVLGCTENLPEPLDGVTV